MQIDAYRDKAFDARSSCRSIGEYTRQRSLRRTTGYQLRLPDPPAFILAHVDSLAGVRPFQSRTPFPSLAVPATLRMLQRITQPPTPNLLHARTPSLLAGVT